MLRIRDASKHTSYLIIQEFHKHRRAGLGYPSWIWSRHSPDTVLLVPVAKIDIFLNGIELAPHPTEEKSCSLGLNIRGIEE